MPRRPSLSFLLCLLAALPGLADAQEDFIIRVSRKLDARLKDSDQRILRLETELASLARIPAEQTGERLGYHSRILQGSPEPLWVQVDLGSIQTFDTVVVVPVVLPKEQGGIEGYGFPVRFKLESSSDADFSAPVMLADATESDMPNPARTPHIVRCARSSGRFVRLTVTVASGRRNKQGRVDWPSVALAELMVLRGEVNLAAGRSVTAPTSREAPPVWSLQNLTDSESILGPPVAAATVRRRGWHSIAYPHAESAEEIVLDLGKSIPVDEVRLFPMRWEGYPHWVGFGFPVRFTVDSAQDLAFAQPHRIVDFQQADVPNPGMNPVVLPSDGARARYVRITCTRLWERFTDHAAALSEVQVFSEGVNAALHAKVETTSVYPEPPWAGEYLVDGNASDNPILPLSTWISQLERSSALEKDLSAARKVRAARLAQWRSWAWRGLLAAGVAVVLSGAGLFVRGSLRRRQELRQLRERIARDLHDEVGSNLAGIALLTREAGKSDEATRTELLQEIQRVAEETSGSMHDLVWMIQPGAPGDMVSGLRALAERMLKGRTLHFTPPQEAWRGTLSLEARRELYLMCKEVLQNIVKHSQATRVEVLLHLDGKTLVVTIRDDGTGFDPSTVSSSGFGLGNLQVRARRMGGSCTIESTAGKGALVRMQIPLD